ncbi:MAG: acetate--CoA ligase family protein [Lautropia sp.]
MSPLDGLFDARGIAFVGVTENPGGYGARIVRYCLDGGYDGDVAFVNPRHAHLFGRRCHPDLRDVPGVVDVVVAMVGPGRIAEVYAAAAQRGARYFLVVGELVRSADPDGAGQLDRLRGAIRDGGPRIVGPVCVGVVAPPARLCVSISSALTHGMPRAGGIGLISQSGGIIGAVIDRSRLSGAGFSSIVSSGGEFDLGLCDYVEHLIDDPATRVIAIYCEGFGDPSRFLALAGRARRADTPIVLLKAGRTEVGAKAALSHSGRIASDGLIEETILRRHGLILVDDIDDLHVTASVLERSRVRAGTGIGAASLSGGYSVVVGDALSRADLPIATLSAATCEALREEVAQPHPANPVDAGARPTPGREALDVRAAMAALDADSNVGVTVYAETTFLNPETVVEPLAEFVASASKPHLTCWQAGPAMAGVVARLRDRGVLVIDSLAQTTAALRGLYQWAAGCEPPPVRVPALGAEALAGVSPGMLDNDAARNLLGAYGIALVAERVVAAGQDPGAAAAAMGLPVVLKGLLPGVAHKTERGLVAVGLGSRDAIDAAAEAMRARNPGLAGFVLQPFLSDGIEMIAGVKSDAQLGAVVLLGFGGVFAEAMGPPAIEAAPLGPSAADALIDRVDRKGVLRGYRTGRAHARDRLAELLVRLGDLAAGHRERVAEIDLNPVIVGERAAVAVDWLVVVRDRAD